ncbi:hypothetical protein ISS03_00980 [Patescibacteria group bacterium]|nr:hypothetical protein [Patescibacteria group bacterium]
MSTNTGSTCLIGTFPSLRQIGWRETRASTSVKVYKEAKKNLTISRISLLMLLNVIMATNLAIYLTARTYC